MVSNFLLSIDAETKLFRKSNTFVTKMMLLVFLRRLKKISNYYP